MKAPRGKAVAIGTVVLALAVLSGAAFASRERIVAEYYLWRLGTEAAGEVKCLEKDDTDSFAKTPASEAMVAKGARAVPILLRGIERTNFRTQIRAAWALGQLGSDAETAVPALMRLRDGIARSGEGGPKEDRLVLLAAVRALQKL